MPPQPEPVHPGAVLRERFLGPLELSSNQVAKAIGVLPDAVRRISQEGMGPSFWAGLQMEHDLAIAARELNWGISARSSRWPARLWRTRRR